MQREQVLMTAAETAEYLNMGMTKTRELMKEQQNVFVVLIGKKKYVHKVLLDKWMLHILEELLKIHVRIGSYDIFFIK